MNLTTQAYNQQNRNIWKIEWWIRFPFQKKNNTAEDNKKRRDKNPRVSNEFPSMNHRFLFFSSREFF
jgi:hypothetical protein